MYLHDFIQVNIPFPIVREHVLNDSKTWLSEVATEACSDADELKARIGLDHWHTPSVKKVTVSLGKPVSREDLITVPVQWHGSGAKGMFPTMDGELEITALGSDCTHVGLMARYEPPLRPVGRSLDGILVHHLAEHSVRTFLRRVSEVVKSRSTGGQ